MNPNTNKFEPLSDSERQLSIDDLRRCLGSEPGQLYRPDGSPVPEHWPVFNLGEEVTLKGHVFKVYGITEDDLILRPVRPA